MRTRAGKLVTAEEAEAFDAGVASVKEPLKKEWKETRAKYGSGEELWIGKIKVGSWFNPVGSKGDPMRYRAVIDLPGITMKPETVDHPDREAAKTRVERAVDTWFKWLEG